MPQTDGDGRSESRPSDSKHSSQNPRSALAAALPLGVAVAALILALVVPGPAGPGTRMAQHAVGGPVSIGPSCTHYPGAEVTIQVPGTGTIVVTATVGVGINHAAGVNDEARIVVSGSSTECALDDYTAFVSVPHSLPTDSFHFATIPVLRPFPVQAGTYSFYVNGAMAAGSDAGDRFDSASIVAVFYPP